MPDIERWTVAEPFKKMACGLGEAPFWEKDTHTLRFFDIVKEKLHILDLERGPSSLQTFDLGTAVSTSADIEGTDTEILVGAKEGFALMNRETKELKYVKRVWEERDGPGKTDRMRMNDGCVDPQGRYWAGAMNDPKVHTPTAEGVLFRFDQDGSVHRMLSNTTIANGMGWSADGKVMYFTDSPTGNIFKYDFDGETGSISRRSVFYHVEEDGAVPDGFAMDKEGNLWVALCGGGKVAKVTPEGEKVGEISLPTRMISCPAFVGRELYITSAEEEEPEKFPQSVEFGGSLFRVEVGVEGAPLCKYVRRW